MKTLPFLLPLPVSKIKSQIAITSFKKFKPRGPISKVTPSIQVNRNVIAPRQIKQIPIHTRPISRVALAVKTMQTRQIAQPAVRPYKPTDRFLIPEIRKRALERAKIASRESIKQHRSFTRAAQSITAIKTITSLKGRGNGRILVVIAAGPSINEVDFFKIHNHPLIDTMCINRPYEKLWPTTYWAFCDHTQHRRNVQTFESYRGIILNSTNVKARKPNQIVFRSKPGKGFSKDVTTGYHIGRSSTYAAMQVIHYMNYAKTYIFGVDMNPHAGKLHWYGQNPDVSNDNRKQRFAAEADNYLWAAKYLTKDERDKYVFCSNYLTWPFADYFPRHDHKEAVDKMLEYAKTMQK